MYKAILVEVNIPKYIYQRILLRKKLGAYRGVVEDIVKSRKSGITRVFIKYCPKGWWVALKILREGSGKLYILEEVSYMDVPSRVMELSMKRRWKPEYEEIIERELKKWGLKYE